MRNKVVSVAKVANMIPSGTTIMYDGFLDYGSAHRIIGALAQKGTKDLTIIDNDCGMTTDPNSGEFYDVAKLMHNHQVKHVIATHAGMTPDVSIRGMMDEILAANLISRGTLTGMIRTGGADLGNVLAPTGVDTIMEDSPFCLDKQTADGGDYLLMKPICTGFVLTNDHPVDKFDSIWYKGTVRSFNAVMATAADVVIAETDNVMEIGDTRPGNVVTFGVLVNYIVSGGNV